uniref:Uncharacterized protein n=1 Tax=Phasianus colchicus TaxID=9054 RepID=A0A669PWS8_PHACC
MPFVSLPSIHSPSDGKELFFRLSSFLNNRKYSTLNHFLNETRRKTRACVHLILYGLG